MSFEVAVWCPREREREHIASSPVIVNWSLFLLRAQYRVHLIDWKAVLHTYASASSKRLKDMYSLTYWCWPGLHSASTCRNVCAAFVLIMYLILTPWDDHFVFCKSTEFDFKCSFRLGPTQLERIYIFKALTFTQFLCHSCDSEMMRLRDHVHVRGSRFKPDSWTLVRLPVSWDFLSICGGEMGEKQLMKNNNL